ncbi:glutathione-dependent formaldehyde-activating, GFA, partial [Mycena olivaceomarginata]
MSDTPQTIEYRGNCHCGAFRFTFRTPPLEQVFICNCSICSRNGYIFGCCKGDENSTLRSYHFGKGMLEHKFCPTCGTSVMRRGADGNIRTLADVDLYSCRYTSDGAALNRSRGAWTYPQVTAMTFRGLDSLSIYHGFCKN